MKPLELYGLALDLRQWRGIPLCETFARAAPGPAAGAWHLALSRAKLQDVLGRKKRKVAVAPAQETARARVRLARGPYVYEPYPVPMRDNAEILAAWCVTALQRQWDSQNQRDALQPPLLARERDKRLALARDEVQLRANPRREACLGREISVEEFCSQAGSGWAAVRDRALWG